MLIIREGVENDAWCYQGENVAWQEVWVPLNKVEYAKRAVGTGGEQYTMVCTGVRYLILKISFEEWQLLVSK